MKEKDFKKGAIVTVVKVLDGHNFSIGEIIALGNRNIGASNFREGIRKDDRSPVCRWVTREEVDLIDKTIRK